VPVTAKLSKLFYDTLGEQIANEFVEWFNQVDATYRADLRDINELNFARFDAKLEQRLAQFEAKLEQRLAQSDAKIERRASELHALLSDFEVKIERRLGALEATMERRFGEQGGWFILAWATLLASSIGLWLR
jgi:DNA anti-recombination protein RmuC